MSKMYQLWRTRHRQRRMSNSAGFTLLEMVTAASILGILVVIAAPSWHAYQSRVTLRIGQDKALQIMRQAQSKATVHRVGWESSFREVDGRVQAAFHPTGAFPQEIVWENLPNGVHIDTQRSSLYKKDGVYRVRFDHHGNVSGQLGRLTLMNREQDRLRSCVIASTLTGALRIDMETKAKDKGCSPAK